MNSISVSEMGLRRYCSGNCEGVDLTTGFELVLGAAPRLAQAFLWLEGSNFTAGRFPTNLIEGTRFVA
ncbi:MAG: hypothetical protein ACXV2C_07415 [Candidatus Bathyarchaeia archaeon]